LTNNKLIISSYKRPTHSSRKEYFIPKKTSIKIKIQDIKHLILGTGKFFDKLSNKNQDEELKSVISSFKEETFMVNNESFIPLKMWKALKHTPFLYIATKKEKNYLVSTKPYTKKDFKKLFNQLKKMKILCLIQDINL
jgi:hypothetical protein